MRKHPIVICLIATFLLLASLSNAHADEKLPVPSEKEQSEVVELLKEIYGDQMSSRDADVKKELAKTLLEQAENPSNDAASRYVLLHLAATHAAEIGDADLALSAISKMETLYRARTSEIRFQILSQAQRSAREVGEFAALANGYAELVMIAIREDNYDIGRQAAQQALVTAQRTRDRDFMAPFRELRGTVAEAEQMYQAVASSFSALQSNPDNPGANLAVGRYLAFMKGNWSEGLPHLAKGSDKDIGPAAQTDLGSPQEAESLLALGNAWYAIAEKESNENMKNGIILRAAEHYRKALPTLDGLAKARVERRVLEADEIAASATSVISVSAPADRSRHGRQIPVRALDLENGYVERLPNESFTTSSPYNSRQWPDGKGHHPHYAKFSNTTTHSNWSAGANNQNQWIQVDLGGVREIGGVGTMGRAAGANQFVTSYSLKGSINGKDWDDILTEEGDEVFEGNSDTSTPKIHKFSHVLRYRYIRFIPRSWHRHITMRIEVYPPSR